MKGSVCRPAALLLWLALALSSALPVLGAEDTPLSRSARWVAQAVPSPQVASVGGEWAVIGLARSGRLADESRAAYLSALEDVLVRSQGVLSQRKYSEYARVVLALNALGEDPRDAAGYDLTAPLLDAEQVARQGINGPIFALLALNSGGGHEEAAEGYLRDILLAQGEDGGWSLAGARADPDVTAQALQALAPYAGSDGGAARAVEAGLACLEALRQEGAFLTSESCAQAIIAWTALERRPPDGLVQALLGYQQEDGSFSHLSGGKSDLMASEQALCALTALARQERGLFPLYDMTAAGAEGAEPGLLETLLSARPGVPAAPADAA